MLISDYAREVDLKSVDGTGLDVEGFPLLRALRGETVRNATYTSVRTHKTVHIRTNASPLHDASGDLVGAVAVDRDVTELVEFDKLKDQFIRVAAHELKTPVAIMKGYAQHLLRVATGMPPAVASSLTAIERGSRRIDRIVRDLLDLSQIQIGSIELRRERMDLTELAESLTRRAALTTNRHDVMLADSDSVVVVGDRARLEQVIGNLLDNAIRYSPKGGEINVRVALTSTGEVEVSVRDRGVGIAKEKQGRMFECFYRPHTDTPYDHGGMGVGLFISRYLIEKHGGSMTFESQEGEGSTFSFRLPVPQ